MDKKKKIEINGIIICTLPNTTFKVKLDNGNIIFAYISGKIRKNYIKILNGDKVTVELISYNSDKGRIIFRNK